MKHNPKITVILLFMFLLTQFIGLYMVNHYSTVKVVNGEIKNVSAPDLPFNLETPKVEKQSDYYSLFSGLIIAFIIAILLLLMFTKLEWKFILRLWFFIVIILALAISFYAITQKLGIEKLYFQIPIFATSVAVPLAFIKIYRQNFFIHNITELFIYPGIAVVFSNLLFFRTNPNLGIFAIILLLIFISSYDMWAVWRSGIMQKMAKYQINTLKIFSGFFVPYVDKKTRARIRLFRTKYKNKKISKKELNKKRFKVNVAILGGGDIVFPIITAGVVLQAWGFASAIPVIIGATLGLTYLFLFSEKKKFYPAMPFITAGIFLGMLFSWLVF
jgi:presenilin-like A22 family membrane protease